MIFREMERRCVGGERKSVLEKQETIVDLSVLDRARVNAIMSEEETCANGWVD